MVTTNRRRTTKASAGPKTEQIQREASLEWVPIASMEVTEEGQRRRNEAWVNKLVDTMELEKLGNPVVSLRDGVAYIIDGQHRIEALRRLDFNDSLLECFAYKNLSPAQEAEMFLSRNNSLNVSNFDEFRIGVTAEREDVSEIARIVAELGMVIRREDVPNAISATGTLVRVYRRSDAYALSRTLVIARDVFGEGGRIPSLLLDGIGHVVGRYPQLDDEHMIARLRRSGGSLTLATKAESLHQKTGQPKAQCLAAELVTLYNSGSRHPVGGRLTPWFKLDAPAASLRQTA